MKLSHVLLLTDDMDALKLFFKNALALEEGFRPPFPFDGAWLYGDGKPIIHIARATPADAAQGQYLQSQGSVIGTGLVDHIALEGDNYESLVTRLEQHAYSYFERTVPETKEHQVFVTGPDGLKVEVVFNEDKQPV